MIMNNVFRAGDKKHAHAANGSHEFAALRGEEGKINYRDFGHWADMADESESAEEFERSVLQEQVEHLKKYVVKRTDTKGRGGGDYTDEEKTTIAKGTVRNEFRKRTGMSFQEFFANVKADSVAASA
jgi:hypothetical protein